MYMNFDVFTQKYNCYYFVVKMHFMYNYEYIFYAGMDDCMDFEEKFNPWSVSSLEDFRFYCCPECDCKNVNRDSFVKHVVIAHPHSKIFIDTLTKIKTEQTKECTEDKANIVTLCYTSDDSSDSDSDDETSQPQCTEVDLEPPVLERNDYPKPTEENVIAPHHNDHDYSIPVWDLDKNIMISSVCSLSCEDEPSIEKSPKIFVQNKPYQCNICSKQESSQRELKYHIHSVHTHSELYPLKCDICDKRFNQAAILKRHVESIHEGIRYKCSHCSKTYTRDGDLKKHIRIMHQGLRHKCDMCDKIYTEKYRLKEHIKCHHRKLDDEIVLDTDIFIDAKNDEMESQDPLQLDNQDILKVSITTNPNNKK